MDFGRKDYDEHIKDDRADKDKIPFYEPVFLLRAQDVLAPETLEFYAQLLISAGKTIMAAAVREQAEKMCNWSIKKMPDRNY